MQIANPNRYLKICAEQCGALCCHAPAYIVLDTIEMYRLRDLAGKKKIKFLNEGKGRWAYDLIYNGHAECFFLTNNQCAIYEWAPSQCHRFPTKPTVDCLLWPAVRSKEFSVEICVQQCKARCCKGPTGIPLTMEEWQRIKDKGLRAFAVERLGPYLAIPLKEGEACPFLDVTDMCVVYETRPHACRRYPTEPSLNCLIWPAK